MQLFDNISHTYADQFWKSKITRDYNVYKNLWKNTKIIQHRYSWAVFKNTNILRCVKMTVVKIMKKNSEIKLKKSYFYTSISFYFF